MKKQAVVVIHGIGEQVPMATLRTLVSSVLKERKNPDYPKFHNKPDHMSAGYEQRLLRSLRMGRRPTTDFYEFYWAQHMRDSKLTQVYCWIARLALRSPWQVPKALVPAYSALWIGLIMIVCLFLAGFPGAEEGEALLNQGSLNWSLLGSVLLTILQAFFSYFMLGYVADAARYLMPSPDNIEQRNKIRHEGLELLKNLHSSNRYSRIIIVGHSLGSVIGYDLIRLLWEDFRIPQGHGHVVNDKLAAFEDAFKDIFSSANTASTGRKIEDFQQIQYNLWRAMRTPGLDTPWLITDFITIGSPMAHGLMLMAKNKKDFEARVQELEFPTCPPQVTLEGLYYKMNFEFLENDRKIKISRMVPHHGAPFACTRWANLYFKYRFGVFGDLIGGPLRGTFGEGIKDIPVKSTLSAETPKTWKNYAAYLLSLTLCSHTHYWKTFPNNNWIMKINERWFESSKKESLPALQSEMHL
nr:hypothetical protein [uncultured Desulfuromonas sp.]